MKKDDNQVTLDRAVLGKKYPVLVIYSPTIGPCIIAMIAFMWGAYFLDLETGEKHWVSKLDIMKMEEELETKCANMGRSHNHHKHVIEDSNITDTGEHRSKQLITLFEQWDGFIALAPVLCVFVYIGYKLKYFNERYRKEMAAYQEQQMKGLQLEDPISHQDYIEELTSNTWFLGEILWWVIPVFLAAVKISFDHQDHWSWKFLVFISVEPIILFNYLIPALKIEPRVYFFREPRDVNFQVRQILEGGGGDNDVEMQNVQNAAIIPNEDFDDDDSLPL